MSDPAADPIDRLWSRAQAIRAGRAVVDDPARSDPPDLAGPVIRAVRDHLDAAVLLMTGDPAAAGRLAGQAASGWDAVLAACGTLDPPMARQSNAFHMRLAARHGDFYRRIGNDALLQWPRAARLRSRYLQARSMHALGDAEGALAMALALADDWRAQVPVRMPGLATIEGRAAAWARTAGRGDVAGRMAARAAELTSTRAPWADDGPQAWAVPRTPEGILRFGLAATVIDWPATANRQRGRA